MEQNRTEQNRKKKVSAMHLNPATIQQCPVAGWSVQREVKLFRGRTCSEIPGLWGQGESSGCDLLKVVVCDVAMQNL